MFNLSQSPTKYGQSQRSSSPLKISFSPIKKGLSTEGALLDATSPAFMHPTEASIALLDHSGKEKLAVSLFDGLKAHPAKPETEASTRTGASLSDDADSFSSVCSDEDYVSGEATKDNVSKSAFRAPPGLTGYAGVAGFQGLSRKVPLSLAKTLKKPVRWSSSAASLNALDLSFAGRVPAGGKPKQKSAKTEMADDPALTASTTVSEDSDALSESEVEEEVVKPKGAALSLDQLIAPPGLGVKADGGDSEFVDAEEWGDEVWDDWSVSEWPAQEEWPVNEWANAEWADIAGNPRALQIKKAAEFIAQNAPPPARTPLSSKAAAYQRPSLNPNAGLFTPLSG